MNFFSSMGILEDVHAGRAAMDYEASSAAQETTGAEKMAIGALSFSFLPPCIDWQGKHEYLNLGSSDFFLVSFPTNFLLGPAILDPGHPSQLCDSVDVVDSAGRKSKPIRLIVAQVGRLDACYRKSIENHLKDWSLLDHVSLGALECESVIELEPFEDKPFKELKSKCARSWNGADMANAAFLPELVRLLEEEESEMTVVQKWYQALESMPDKWLAFKKGYEFVVKRTKGASDVRPSREVLVLLQNAEESNMSGWRDVSKQLRFIDVGIGDDSTIPDRSTMTEPPKFELIRFYLSPSQGQTADEKPLAIVLALNDKEDIDALDKYLEMQREEIAVEDDMSSRCKPVVLEVAIEGENEFKQFTEKFHNDETALEGLCEEATKHFRGNLRVSKLRLFAVNGAFRVQIEFEHKHFYLFLDDCLQKSGIEDIVSLQFWASGERCECTSTPLVLHEDSAPP